MTDDDGLLERTPLRISLDRKVEPSLSPELREKTGRAIDGLRDEFLSLAQNALAQLDAGLAALRAQAFGDQNTGDPGEALADIRSGATFLFEHAETFGYVEVSAVAGSILDNLDSTPDSAVAAPIVELHLHALRTCFDQGGAAEVRMLGVEVAFAALRLNELVSALMARAGVDEAALEFNAQKAS